MRGKGEGSVYKRADGMWCATLELPPRDGERRRKVVTSKDKNIVISKLTKLRSELERAGDLPTASQTVESWMTYWLDNIAAKRVRPNTLAGYRSLVVQHIIPAIGTARLDKLTPAHVRKVHDHVTEKHTSTYALNAHRMLAKALKDAESDGRVSRNVAKLTDAPRHNRTDLHALTVEEAIDVIALCIPAFVAEPYDPEPARWATYLLTGARRGELLGLELDRVGDHLDLSWQLQRITDISTAPADYEYRPIVSTLYWTRPKSSAGWRIIPLVEPLRTILSTHMAKVRPNPHGLLFARTDGRPIDPHDESKTWPVALKASKITTNKVRLHDLRHTTVDLLYEAGIPEDVIMEIVGHSTRTTTRGYKAKGNRKRLTDAMEAMSSVLSRNSDDVPELEAKRAAEPVE